MFQFSFDVLNICVGFFSNIVQDVTHVGSMLKLLDHLKRCDGLDGKAEDSGMKGHGFKLWKRQENLKKPLRFTFKYFPYWCKYT